MKEHTRYADEEQVERLAKGVSTIVNELSSLIERGETVDQHNAIVALQLAQVSNLTITNILLNRLVNEARGVRENLSNIAYEIRGK